MVDAISGVDGLGGVLEGGTLGSIGQVIPGRVPEGFEDLSQDYGATVDPNTSEIYGGARSPQPPGPGGGPSYAYINQGVGAAPATAPAATAQSPSAGPVITAVPMTPTASGTPPAAAKGTPWLTYALIAGLVGVTLGGGYLFYRYQAQKA